MSDEKDTAEEAITEKSKESKSKPVSKPKSELSPEAAAAIADAAEARLEAAKSAADEAAEEEYQAAAAEATVVETSDSSTNKRAQEVIFRREMGEPEFFLHKKDRRPPRPVLTVEEEQEISRKVEIPTDQTPKYEPQHILSPEYKGVSNYERGVENFKLELEEKLQNLKSDPDTSPEQITQAEEDLKTLDYLYENFYDGMNVFRTAKNRDKP